MKILLDTHTLLWFGLSNPRLSDRARALIRDPDNQPLVSPASYWEIAIKISLGKYRLFQDVASFVEQQIATNRLDILPISPEHAGLVATLPFHHRDPFDRLLIAQAIHERVPLVSSDDAFDKYPVTRLW